MLSPTLQRLARQTVQLTRASIKARYRKTFAGFIWVLLNPLIMFGVQSLVFKQFLRMDVPNYYVFLLSGLIPWIFMVQTIQMSTPTLVGASGLLKAFKFHPGVLVASVALDNFFNFMITLALLAIPTMLSTDTPLTGLLLLPLALVPFITGTIALSMLSSLLNVFFRDTNFVLSFVFSIFFFITPVFYPVEYIPQSYHWLVELNVLYQLMYPIRAAIYGTPLDLWLVIWVKSMAYATGPVLVSYWYWRRRRNGIYIHL